LRGKEAVLVTDPFGAELGYPTTELSGDIVTLSHLHPGHNNAEGVANEPRVVRGPGEYEIRDIFIIGMGTYHDASQGQERGKNTVYLIEMDDIKVCHLGDLGHALSPQQVEELGNVDVVMIPVGGVSTIDAKAARELVLLLSAKLVIPMHYQTEVSTSLEPVALFLKEMGIAEAIPQPKLVVTRPSMPSELQVALLEHPLQLGDASAS
jgi:L-ascorbate metabolism protein UlaG (beta-lactamase superfamily)